MTGPENPTGAPDPSPVRRRGIGRTARRVAVAATGSSLLGVGIILLVLPGPGLLVMIAGLAVLATEFAWAERRLHQARAYAARAADAARRRRNGAVPPTVVDLTDAAQLAPAEPAGPLTTEPGATADTAEPGPAVKDEREAAR